MIKPLSKKMVIILLPISLIITLFIGYTLYNQVENRTNLKNELNQTTKQLNNEKSKYNAREKAVNQEAMVEASKSDDPSLNTVSTQNADYQKVQKVSTQFFSQYYAWSDTKSYLDRVNKVSSIITPELAKDKSVFDDGKDTTGGDFIKATGVKSEFQSADAYMTVDINEKVQALVKVTNLSWYNDNRQDAGTAVHYYDLTYDLKTNKISSLKMVINQKSGSEDN